MVSGLAAVLPQKRAETEPAACLWTLSLKSLHAVTPTEPEHDESNLDELELV